MNRIIIAALFTALSLGTAQAGTATVRHGDLNLASPADLQTLGDRVREAATLACGPYQVDFGVSARTLYEAEMERKACVGRTASQALKRILADRTGTTTRIARQN